MNSLPLEVLGHILSFSKPYSTVVCKRWNRAEAIYIQWKKAHGLEIIRGVNTEKKELNAIQLSPIQRQKLLTLQGQHLTYFKAIDIDILEVNNLIAKCSSLTTLTVWCEKKTSKNDFIGQIFKFTHLTSLTELSLRGLTFNNSDSEALGNSKALSNLKKLHLGCLDLGFTSAEFIASISARTCLETLDLENNRVGDVGVKALTKVSWPNLTHLSFFGWNGIKKSGLKSLSIALEKIPKLTTLDLTHNLVEQIGSLTTSQYATNLKNLSIEGSHIGDIGAADLARSPYVHLLELNLTDSKLTVMGFRTLFQSSVVLLLEKFTCKYWLFGTPEAEELAASPNLRNLREINIFQNSIGDVGFEAILKSPNSAKLSKLVLYNNQITTKGIRALVAANLKYLTDLNVSANRIASLGIALLFKSETGKRLRILKCSSCDIGPSGFERINPANLIELDLDYNRLGDKEAISLADNPNSHELKILYMKVEKITKVGRNAVLNSKYLSQEAKNSFMS